MASMKTLALSVLGLAVAAGIVYFVAFHESSDAPKAPPGAAPTKPKPAAPDPRAEEPAVAQAPTAESRSQVSGPNAALLGGVEGTVRNREKQAVPGAVVELRKLPPQLPLLPRRPDPAETTAIVAKTDVEGKYRIKAPTGENWRIVVSHSDYAPAEMTGISTPPD